MKNPYEVLMTSAEQATRAAIDSHPTLDADLKESALSLTSAYFDAARKQYQLVNDLTAVAFKAFRQ